MKAGRFAAAVASAAAVIAMGVTGAPGSQASEVGTQDATGFEPLGSISFSYGGVTLSIPTGCFLGHSVRGSGKTITSQWASWDCAPPASSFLVLNKNMCNPRIDFVFYDTNNREYYRQTGATQYGCYGPTGPTWNGTPRVAGAYGYTCAALYLNGQLKGRQCHNLTP